MKNIRITIKTRNMIAEATRLFSSCGFIEERVFTRDERECLIKDLHAIIDKMDDKILK